jgi:hypothetical protein
MRRRYSFPRLLIPNNFRKGRDLVKQKITTAENLYRFMMDDFNQSRAFILEFTVVIILIIELIYLFRGHSS